MRESGDAARSLDVPGLASRLLSRGLWGTAAPLAGVTACEATRWEMMSLSAQLDTHPKRWRAERDRVHATNGLAGGVTLRRAQSRGGNLEATNAPSGEPQGV